MSDTVDTMNSQIDELKKYKTLLDNGAITEDEFQAIKAKYLTADSPAKKTPVQSTAKSDLKKNPKILIGAAAAVAVAVIAIILVLIGGSNNPEALAKKYAKAAYVDTKKADSMLAYDTETYHIYGWYARYGWQNKYTPDPTPFFEGVSDDYGYEINSWNSYYKARDNSIREDLESELGKCKVAVELIGERNISIPDLMDEQKGVIGTIARLGFDTEQIKDARVYKVRVIMSGEYSSEMVNNNVYMVKMGSHWKVLAMRYNV